MNDLGTPANANATPTEDPIEPSWKPLFWLLGSLAVLIGLGEILLELGFHILDLLLEVLEAVYMFLIEAPEELLEDRIEEWLEQHYPHDAARYSEIITAFGLTPFKILIGIFMLLWLWRFTHSTLWPRFRKWLVRQYTMVLLAWRELAWPWRILIGLAVVGSLFIFI